MDIEQEKVEMEIMENQRKANEEKDPSKQAIFLELVEESKKKLQEVIEKKKKIPLNNLGKGFDVRKHIEELIKNAKGNQNTNPDPNNDNQNGNPDDPPKKRTPTAPPFVPPNPPNDQTSIKQNWFQENKEVIILGGITLFVFFYVNSQKNEE